VVTMAKKTWNIQLEDGTHTVELDKKWLSGKRTLRVDGQIVATGKSTWAYTGSDDAFQIAAHEGVVHSRTNGFTSNYDLSIDGRSVQTGQPTAPLQTIPKWAWIFVVACVVMPIITLGGAIPALLGIGGAFGCVIISRHPTRSRRAKIMWSLGVTVLCWGLFIAFITIVAGGRTLLTLGQPSWQEFKSPAGRYSVMMPGKPKVQSQTVDTLAGPLELNMAILEDRAGTYTVMYSDYPPDLIQPEAVDSVLDNAAHGGATSMDGEIVQVNPFSMGPFPGREAEFKVPAQGSQPAIKIKTHFFLVNNRMYQVMVLVTQNQVYPEGVQKFFDSFQLIDN
jgi:hypothetical protein